MTSEYPGSQNAPTGEHTDPRTMEKLFSNAVGVTVPISAVREGFTKLHDAETGQNHTPEVGTLINLVRHPDEPGDLHFVDSYGKISRLPLETERDGSWCLPIEVDMRATTIRDRLTARSAHDDDVQYTSDTQYDFDGDVVEQPAESTTLTHHSPTDRPSGYSGRHRGGERGRHAYKEGFGATLKGELADRLKTLKSRLRLGRVATESAKPEVDNFDEGLDQLRNSFSEHDLAALRELVRTRAAQRASRQPSPVPGQPGVYIASSRV